MVDETEQKSIPQLPGKSLPLKQNISRRVVIPGLIGLMIAEAVAGGITWQMFYQGFHKIYLNFAPPVGSGVVRQIVFSSSPNAAPNTYDQLQISLHNISTPPADKIYYAWLENSVSDASQIQHWPLQVTNGTVQGTYQSNPLHTDLLANNTLFLITAEDSGATPVIPSPDISTHLYYAIISRTSNSSPTYIVKQCPGSGATSAGNPCV
jgi:hypothetical protein